MRKICFLFLILLTALNIFSKGNNFELGKKYFEEKKYEQAEKYLKAVNEENKEREEAQLLLAMIYETKKNIH